MKIGSLIFIIAAGTTITIGAAMNGLGYSSQGNELIGQVKKLTSKTPLLCPRRVDAHVSLGVIREGVGSISNEDADLIVTSEHDIATLKRAAETGRLVKIVYNVERIRFCGPDHLVTSASLLDEDAR